MVAHDRPGAVAPLSPPAASPVTQAASLSIAGFHLGLTAGPGSVSLSVALDATRDDYVLEPGALVSWADASARLLALGPAASAAGEADLRAPFLLDVEGRPSIAFACAVAVRGIEFRLLVTGASGRIGTAPADADALRSVIQAARGTAAAACAASTGDSGNA